MAKKNKKYTYLSSEVSIILDGLALPSRGSFKEKFLSIPSKPSIFSLTILITLTLITFLFLQIDFHFPRYLILFQEDSHFQNLIAITGGITSVVIAIVIFVAEAIKEKGISSKVLLQKSNIWLLSYLSVTTFGYYIWINLRACDCITFLAIFPIIFYAITALSSLYNTIRVLTDKQEYLKSAKKIINKEINFQTRDLLEQRVYINTFQNIIKAQNYKLLVNPYHYANHKENYYLFRIEGSGYISNINLKNLRKISDEIDSYAAENKFKFEIDQTVAPNEQSLTPGNSLLSGEINQERYVTKQPTDRIDPDNNIILAINRKLIPEDRKSQFIETIKGLVSKTFIISKKDLDEEEVFVAEISEIESPFIKAIREANRSTIQIHIDIYKDLIDNLIKKLNQTIGNYNNKEATKEMSSLFGSWKSIDWVRDSTYFSLGIALETKVKEVIREIAFLPRYFTKTALEKREALLFRTFMTFPVHFYRYYQEIENASIKGYFLDRSWRSIKEIFEFSILNEYENSDSTPDKKELLQYAKHCLIVMQELLVQAYRNNDAYALNLFYNNFNKISKYNREDGYRDINWPNDIHFQIDIMWFGFASLLLAEINQNSLSISLLPKMLLELNKLSETNILNLYTYLSNRDIGGNWGWDNWDYKEEGEVFSIETNTRLANLLAIMLIKRRSLSNIDERFLEEIDKDFYNKLTGGTNIISVLEGVQQIRETYGSILSDEDINRAQTTITHLTAIKNYFEQKERAKLRSTPISTNLVKSFKEAVITKFIETATLRKVFESVGKFRFEDSSNRRAETRGFNQISQKEDFTEGWGFDTQGLGNYFGEGLADWENEYLVNILLENSEQFEENKYSINKYISENKLIIGVNLPWYRIAKYRENFQITQTNDQQNYVYKYKGIEIPVIMVHIPRSTKKGLLILDMSKIDSLISYIPDIKPNTDINKNIYISITDFSHNAHEKRKILRANPPWLEEKGSDKEDYLQEIVAVKIFESIKLKLHPSFKAKFIKFKRDY